MNKTKRLSLTLAAALMLAGSTTAGAAPWGGEGLRGEDGQLMLSLTTAAGTGELGSLNGAAGAAAFRIPSSVAVLADGTVIVADTRNHQLRKISGGRVTTGAGLVYELDAKGYPIGGLLDGRSDRSLFDSPHGLAVDAKGRIYTADTGNHAVRVIEPDGTVRTLAGSGLIGSADAKGEQASFYSPMDVAAAADGTVYVADTLNHVIRRIAVDGTVTTLNASSTRAALVSSGQAAPAGDYMDGPLAQAKFNEPSGLAMDAQGNLFVSDSGNQRIRYIDLARGTVRTVAGGGTGSAPQELYAPGGYRDGDALEAELNFPMGLSVTGEGGLLIADSQNHAIRYLHDGQLTTIAGIPGGHTGTLDGIEGHAGLQRPMDVAAAPDGTVLVADSFNNRVRVIAPYRLPAGLPQDEKLKVVLNDEQIEFDVEPEIAVGRTMVPVRAVTEALGYEVKFNEDTQAVQLTKDGLTIELYIGQTGLKRTVSGQAGVLEKPTDAAPYIKGDRTFVPLRFFAEETGLDVEWNAEARAAVLRTPVIE